MNVNEENYNCIRILKVRFVYYKMFQGVQEFIFDQKRTLITGDNGTGKTAILNVLSSIDSNVDASSYDDMDNQKATVEVETSGDRELMRRYREVIIINGVNSIINTKALHVYSQDFIDQAEISNKTRINFELILEKKSWKTGVYKDLNPDMMALGEKMCFKYAYLFAIRHALNIDIPVIIDSPYGVLDNELREGFHDFLDSQTCQQILLGTAAEFQSEKAQYNLRSI